MGRAGRMLNSHSGEVMRRRLGAVVIMALLPTLDSVEVVRGGVDILDERLCAGLFMDVAFSCESSGEG